MLRREIIQASGSLPDPWAFHPSVVLTEPPFRNGSFIIPAIIFAIRTDQPFCFGYRSRSAVRSLILDEYASQIRSWRHTTDLLQIAVLYLSTVYSIFKERWKRFFSLPTYEPIKSAFAKRECVSTNHNHYKIYGGRK